MSADWCYRCGAYTDTLACDCEDPLINPFDELTETRNKHGNTKVKKDGYVFDSKAEAERYDELKLMADLGQIINLEIHPRYELQPPFDRDGQHYRAITYVADFSYYDIPNSSQVVEDVKGHRTALYKLKRKMFLLKYGKLKFVEIEVNKKRRK